MAEEGEAGPATGLVKDPCQEPRREMEFGSTRCRARYRRAALLLFELEGDELEVVPVLLATAR
jgi:hypothetical protein